MSSSNHQYRASANNGTYGTFINPKISASFRLQRKPRPIKATHKYSASLSNGSYGKFCSVSTQIIVAKPMNALPANSRNFQTAKSTQILRLRKKGINQIEANSFVHFDNLRELFLNFNFLSNKFDQMLLHNLCRHLLRLQLLDLSFNELTHIDGLQHLKSLQHLNVSNNLICSPSLDQSLCVLKKLKFLEYFDMRWNPMCDDAAIQCIQNELISLKVLNNERLQTQKNKNKKQRIFESQYTEYNAQSLSNVLFSKSIKIENKQRRKEENRLKKAYTFTKAKKSINTQQKVAKYEKKRFELRNEILLFLKGQKRKKDEFEKDEIENIIENDLFSLKYALSKESKERILKDIEIKISFKRLFSILMNRDCIKWIEKSEQNKKKKADKLFAESMSLWKENKEKMEQISKEQKAKIFDNYLKAQSITMQTMKNKKRKNKKKRMKLTEEVLHNVKNSNFDFCQKDYIKNTLYFGQNQDATQSIKWF